MCTAPVTDHHAVILPVAFQNLVERILVLTAVLILVEVVRSHDAPGVAFLDGGLKGWQVNLTQGAVAHDHVDLMAVFLVVVKAEVLDAGCRSGALQTLDVGHYHARSQQGILAHVLKVTSVQRITVDVHARTQDHVFSTIAGLFAQAAAV